MTTRQSQLITMLAVTLFSSGLASAKDAKPVTRWVSEDQKKVYFVYRPELKVVLSHIGVDDEYWDRLDVSVEYSNPVMKRAHEEMTKSFPGYALSQVIVDKSGDFHLTIPALSVDETVSTMPGQNGPYFQWMTFVPRLRSQALRDALKSDQAVIVSGNINVTFPELRMLERIELGVATCNRLTASGDSLFDIMRNFTSIANELDGLNIKFESTREALKRSILESCLELPSDVHAGSFAKLLRAKATLKSDASAPVGEYRSEQMSSRVVPLSVDIAISISEGGA